MIINRVTAVAHEGQREELVEMMKTEARALFRVAKISTYAHRAADSKPEGPEKNVVIFDLEFEDMALFDAWRAAVPDNQDFFDRWGSKVASYTGQTLQTHD